jgi:hypothetical protein
MSKETELQKLALEKVLEDKELRKYLPEHLQTNGMAMILAKKISLVDDDNHDTYRFGIKFKIVPREELSEALSTASTSNRIVEEEQSKTILSLSDITDYLKKNNAPILFDVNASTKLNKKFHNFRLELPQTVINRPDGKGGFSGARISDFISYWSINPDVGVEIVIWPKKNHELLGENELAFLNNTYKYHLAMEYTDELKLPNLLIKDDLKTVSATIVAEGNPYVIIRIDKEHLKGAGGYKAEKPDVKKHEENKTIQSGTTGLDSSLTREIINSPEYAQMSKFDLIEKKRVTPQKALYPPAKMLRQHLGEERYSNLKVNEVIDDLVLMYRENDAHPDAVITSKKNLGLLEANKDAGKMFSDHYNSVMDIKVKIYGNEKQKILQFLNVPLFLREKGTEVTFYAANTFYIEMQVTKSDVPVSPTT